MRASGKEREEIMSRATASVSEAAKVLGIGRSQAYKAVNDGEIRSIRTGGRVLVPTSAIQELLDGAHDAA